MQIKGGGGGHTAGLEANIASLSLLDTNTGMAIVVNISVATWTSLCMRDTYFVHKLLSLHSGLYFDTCL